ncbi:MAG TPA: hypothetical protein PKA55_06200 [Rhodoblastus sp.]|nr:hypothetical protein [Rhodoblastus sp.]
MNIKTLFAAAAFAGAAFVASQASAMPVAPQSSGIGVEQVRFGCPAGMQPTRYGRCRMMSARGRAMARRTYIRRHERYERRHRW